MGEPGPHCVALGSARQRVTVRVVAIVPETHSGAAEPRCEESSQEIGVAISGARLDAGIGLRPLVAVGVADQAVAARLADQPQPLQLQRRERMEIERTAEDRRDLIAVHIVPQACRAPTT